MAYTELPHAVHLLTGDGTTYYTNLKVDVLAARDSSQPPLLDLLNHGEEFKVSLPVMLAEDVLTMFDDDDLVFLWMQWRFISHYAWFSGVLGGRFVGVSVRSSVWGSLI